MRAAAVLAVSVLALAACNPGKKAGETQGPGTEAAPPAAAPAAPGVPAGPATLPHRRPGLWETSMTFKDSDRAPHVTRMCLDEATEAKSSLWGEQMSHDMCQEHRMQRQLDGSWTFSSVCNMGSGGVTHSSGVASGDLTSNYTVRMHASTSGAELPMMNRDDTFTVAAHRIGPCEPGQRGGDMIVNGRVVANLNDLAAMQGQSGRP
jgi:hypothetical protein